MGEFPVPRIGGATSPAAPPGSLVAANSAFPDCGRVCGHGIPHVAPRSFPNLPDTTNRTGRSHSLWSLHLINECVHLVCPRRDHAPGCGVFVSSARIEITGKRCAASRKDLAVASISQCRARECQQLSADAAVGVAAEQGSRSVSISNISSARTRLVSPSCRAPTNMAP
jgi:hypothetical protein